MNCSIDGCARRKHARGMCSTHDRRTRLHGNPHVTRPRGGQLGVERKTTKHATCSPVLQDLAWAAGFLEGEGTFDKAGGSCRVSAPQVNGEPLQRLLAIFGGAVTPRYQPKMHAKFTKPASPILYWYVSGSRARGIAMTLYQFMSTKRQGQIRVALG